MDILTWLIFGIVVGAIANIIDPKPSQGGIIGSMILGVLGAFLGGFLGRMIFGTEVTGFNFPSLALSVLGALLLLLIGRMLIRS